MTADEAIAAIRELVPDARFGMAQKESGGLFEVWAKDDRSGLGFQSAATLDKAFTALFEYVRSQIWQYQTEPK